VVITGSSVFNFAVNISEKILPQALFLFFYFLPRAMNLQKRCYTTELNYPYHDKTLRVSHCGRMCFNKNKIHLSQAFSGQDVGIKEIGDRIWLVSFMDYDLGYFDEDSELFEELDYPFVPEIV